MKFVRMYIATECERGSLNRFIDINECYMRSMMYRKRRSRLRNASAIKDLAGATINDTALRRLCCARWNYEHPGCEISGDFIFFIFQVVASKRVKR